jgi:hypothetical protein
MILWIPQYPKPVSRYCCGDQLSGHWESMMRTTATNVIYRFRSAMGLKYQKQGKHMHDEFLVHTKYGKYEN